VINRVDWYWIYIQEEPFLIAESQRERFKYKSLRVKFGGRHSYLSYENASREYLTLFCGAPYRQIFFVKH
jgi:hypothetical protein